MRSTTREWTVEETLAQSEFLADDFESADPEQHSVHPAAEYWLMCAAQRAATTGHTDPEQIRTLVTAAREAETSWDRIGELLDITAEAAQAEFG